MRQNLFISIIAISIASIAILFCLTGCFTTDSYHNKEHINTINKDMDSMHRDIDKVLGIDEPSPLVEKE